MAKQEGTRAICLSYGQSVSSLHVYHSLNAFNGELNLLLLYLELATACCSQALHRPILQKSAATFA
jgi:hypothetical protein